MAGKTLFGVIRTRGDAWQPSLPLEEQWEWNAHAAFMDGLESEGFLVLGGPLEGTPDVLLIVRAENAEQIVERLLEDPWSSRDLLRVSRVSPWTLRLGTLRDRNFHPPLA